jgi:hypothetical protein
LQGSIQRRQHRPEAVGGGGGAQARQFSGVAGAAGVRRQGAAPGDEEARPRQRVADAIAFERRR